MNTNTFDETKPLEPDSTPHKQGRPAKKLYWQKIERYQEERTLRLQIEDIFLQSIDTKTLF